MLLEIQDVRKCFDVHGRGGPVCALAGVDLAIGKTETVGVVGESGCGKSTLARCIMGLVPVDSGRIAFDGVNIVGLKPSTFRMSRRRIQMVFQDPSSLNPSFTVSRTLAEPVRLSGVRDRGEIRERIREALAQVELPETFGPRRPHQLSGGQKQRVGIARAVILRPQLLVLDEPTASLDQSLRGGVIALLRRLQVQSGMTYLFLSHDLSTVRKLCNRVYIMFGGRVVEAGPTEVIYSEPRHPYTRALIDAIPVADPARRRRDWGKSVAWTGQAGGDVGELRLVGEGHYVAASS